MKSFVSFLSSIKSYIRYLFYASLIGLAEPGIKKRIRKKQRVNVVFFVINVGMWKNDFLFQILQKDSRFNPCIVSFLYPFDPLEYKLRVSSELRTYFEGHGYQYYDGYDFTKNQYIDLKTLEPDIIFYAQPSNVGYKGFLIESMWKQSLLAYSPYCLSLDSTANRKSFLLEAVGWRFFCPTEYHKQLFSKLNYNNGRNIIVTGYSMTDYLCAPPHSDGPWKNKDLSFKRIIWAPHHSVLPDDHLNYSTFLEVAEDMLNLAKAFSDKIQIAFKPHPRLITKLYSLDGWGPERTDSYFNEWNSMPNTVLADGEYVDLFLTSDALIHDCSSFTAEYLYTGKPVMYLSKPDHIQHLNDLGIACYEQHYKGESINDIISFIQHVVLEGKDEMKEERISFVKNALSPKNGEVSAINVYNELLDVL